MAEVTINDTTVIKLTQSETEALRQLLALGFAALCATEPTDREHLEELKVTAGDSFSLLDALAVPTY